jgi:hypothetical protein
MARDPCETLILVPTLFIVSPLALGRSRTGTASTSTDGRHTQWVINLFSSLAFRLAQIEADAKV